MIEHQPSPVSLVVPMFGGIHRGLRELFAAKKKGGALKVLRRLEISAGDLARLIHNCGDLGLAHVGKRRFFTPPDMITTQEEAEAFWKTAAATLEASPSSRYLTKMTLALEYRRVLWAHIFWSETAWHLFYFDRHDREGHPGTQWDKPHLHYLSHLWGLRMTREQVWAEMDSTPTRLPKVHVRFWQLFPMPAPSREGEPEHRGGED